MLPQNWLHGKITSRSLKQPHEHISNSVDNIRKKQHTQDFISSSSIKQNMALQINSKSVDKYTRVASERNTGRYFGGGRSRNLGYMSHLMNYLRREDRSKEPTPEKYQLMVSKSDMKQELTEFKTNLNLMAPSKVRHQPSSRSKPKTKSPPHRPHNHASITHTPMTHYTRFIESTTPYTPQLPSLQLRFLQKIDALHTIDLTQYKLAESIIQCLVDCLSDPKTATQTLVLQYCGLYFQNEERRKLEVAANWHLLRNFEARVRPGCVHGRLWVYLAALLAANGAVFAQGVRELVLAGLKLVHRFLLTLFEAVMDAINKSAVNVLEAFKTLKVVKQVQKISTEFDTLLSQLQPMLHTPTPALSQPPLLCQTLSSIISALSCHLPQGSLLSPEQSLLAAQLSLSWQHLEVPPIPYLPQQPSSRQYTLVMGLNKLLVLYSEETRVLKYRPYMDAFLGKLREGYELVVFSEMEKGLTDRILKEIEREETFFTARLYRNHLLYKNSKIIKDVTKLGRPLSRVLLLEADAQFLGENPANQLHIPQFTPSTKAAYSLVKDRTLLNLLSKLGKISQEHPSDIRGLLARTADLHHIPEAATIEQRSISGSRGADRKSTHKFI